MQSHFAMELRRRAPGRARPRGLHQAAENFASCLGSPSATRMSDGHLILMFTFLVRRNFAALALGGTGSEDNVMDAQAETHRPADEAGAVFFFVMARCG